MTAAPGLNDDDVSRIRFDFDSVPVLVDGPNISKSNLRDRAEFSDKIFVARVINWRNTSSKEGVLWSTFDVELIRSIKPRGSSFAVKAVELMQGFGSDGKFYAHPSDSPVILGQSYIFWSKGETPDGFPRILPSIGSSLLSPNAAKEANDTPPPAGVAQVVDSVNP